MDEVMAMAISVQLVYLGTAVTFAGGAAVHDLLTKKIPNWITGPGILLGVLLHLVLGGVAQAGWSLLAGLVAGSIFLLFYLAGGMGAGDVKLITAIGCLVGISSIKDVLIASVLIGSVLGLALAAKHGKVRQTIRNVIALMAHHAENGLTAHPELNVTKQETLRLPYALPIALGCMIAFCIGSFAGGTQ
jgi:prepilin peptidase CpaA